LHLGNFEHQEQTYVCTGEKRVRKYTMQSGAVFAQKKKEWGRSPLWASFSFSIAQYIKVKIPTYGLEFRGTT
jgi:hypothetical protein